MRKRYRILMLAALVAAIVVPVGYALSLESAPVTTRVRYEATLPPVAAAVLVTPVALRSGDRLPARHLSGVPDAAKLLGVGTILFGLAAALRKSSQG
jgi:hypothetical protein